MHLRAVCASSIGVVAIALAAGVLASCSKAPDPPQPPAPPLAVVAAPAAAAAAPEKPAPPLLTPKPVSSPAKPSTPPGGQKPDVSKPIPMASKADVVVTDMAAGRTVFVNVGQTLGVVGSTDATTWQVDYTGEALKMLTPADRVKQPGQAGWVWRAMSPGTVEVAFTSKPPCPVRPCESNPMRVAFPVEVRRQ
jgi:hypothetical protein